MVGGRDPSAADTSRTEKATDCRYKDYDSNLAISAEVSAERGERKLQSSRPEQNTAICARYPLSLCALR